MSYCLVYVTAPVGKPAQTIAQEILKKRLAACVNIVPKVKSSYWWKGKIEQAEESLLIIKTRKSLLKKLMRFVPKIHSYLVPEVIALSILKGHKPYLDWVNEETKA